MSFIVNKVHQTSIAIPGQDAGGTVGVRVLKPTEAIIASKFSAAHRSGFKKRLTAEAGKQSGRVLVADNTRSTQAGIGAEQVDARELASAIALRGRDEDPKKSKNKHRYMYQIMFSTDGSFLQRDLESFKATLITKGKSICDLAKLDTKDLALRKYLLISILEDEAKLTASESQAIQQIKQQIKSESGDYIAKVFAHFELAFQTKDAISVVDRVSLKEYIAAYKLVENDIREVNNPVAILPLFRLLKKQGGEEAFLQSLEQNNQKLIFALKRETSQYPTRASSLRQHIIASQLNQLKTIRVMFNVNKAYVEAWKKTNAVNIPNPLDLLELTLRVVSGEIVSAITDMVRQFAAVKAGTTVMRNLLNAMITHYINCVLQQPKMQNLFRAVSAYQQMMEQLRKNVSPGAVLSARRPYVQ